MQEEDGDGAPSASGVCRLVLISDTHGKHRELDMPPGDVLIHAGDFTRFGRRADAEDFDDWLASLPYAERLVVLGNHEANAEWAGEAGTILAHATLLSDAFIRLACGVGVYGTAFYWPADGPGAWRPPYDAIPRAADVIVSHGPCAGRVDGGMGCGYLLEHVERVRPLLVVSGHVHEARGVIEGGSSVTFVNASNANPRDGGGRKIKSASRSIGPVMRPYVYEVECERLAQRHSAVAVQDELKSVSEQ
jgi:hypothetical protein